MARRVEAALHSRSVAVLEAGTGTGKTLAYLVPAMLCGGKTIISTGTKTLQDQLYHRDIPAVREALNVPVSVALLKGRANYVCHYHLERGLADARLSSREVAGHLRQIARFAAVDDSGDRMALKTVPEDSPAWAYAVSSRDNCLGGDCPYHRDCFVLKARKRALEADIVVINHHLFFADVWLKDEGAGELLPAANAVIFDEAHQLPETASLFFGESLTTGMLLELARDVREEADQAAGDFLQLNQAATDFDQAVRPLRLQFNAAQQRLPAARALSQPGFAAALGELQTRLDRLRALLEAQAERSEGLKNCLERATQCLERLARWRGPDDESCIRWLEVGTHAVMLHVTPLDVSELFSRQVEDGARGWLFTSATLAVRGDFSHFLDQLGLTGAETGCWDSPFDYDGQALLYVPQAMPDPNTPEYTRAVVEAAWPVLEASGGRAFLLFTSLRAMNEAHGLLQAKMAEADRQFPLLLQGAKSRTELLTEFRALGNAVLLGSQTFWEGIDVAGEALSLVVIDRLPFQPPDDPVLAARIDAMKRAGKNAFFDYQLPHAIINLKQGAGRLIRRESDRGVLMICDTRLVDKPYGRRIWQALPPMRRSRKLADVLAFFQTEPALAEPV
ncbi:ATP-dependent DNA helicase DinG [Sulfuritortus calidifontis]|uniref:ATP-dependent DNA helicase DinG n=1 Tax=Sulfuritortus calidifontis TaxID=1914471 RepID=A0A4R3JT60_9PROT|nr:ATP-dependent DNA helicase DinG [Sulfuritortus calidifontis]